MRIYLDSGNTAHVSGIVILVGQNQDCDKPPLATAFWIVFLAFCVNLN